MNAFTNHTSTVAQASALQAEQVIASLASELQAAGRILNTLHHYSPLAPILHAMADLNEQGIVEQDLLRNAERKAVLCMAKQFLSRRQL